MLDLSGFELGRSTEGAFQINTREESAEVALELVKQCKQKLAIISHDLDPFVYDQIELVEAMRKLVTNNRYVDVRILVFEPEMIVRKGHKLIDLAGKVSSFIQIRKPSIEYKTFNEAVLIADEVGYLFRENTERYKGKVNFNSPRESKYLLDVFNNMWEKAKPDPNLRRMHI